MKLWQEPPSDSIYFHNLFLKVALERGLEAIDSTPETIILCQVMELMHKDYRKSIIPLSEKIDKLCNKLDGLRQPQATQPPTTTEPPTQATCEAPESTSKTDQQPSPPSAPVPASVGATSWATVIRKREKKAPNTPKPALADKPTSLANAPMPKKGITMRERRLVIKCDGSPLALTAIELQDTINTALSSTYIQTMSLTGGNITLTTMETVKATSLNCKASAFLHLIPEATTIHLDTLTTQLHVHGLNTCDSLATIISELTTFNSGIALTKQLRWLTLDASRVSKNASTAVITVTSPKALLFIAK
ncbi:hypothetical protein L873DRAFT_1933951 [Choiromyces venosus 120613-1]|uniref:Uncharacterized protein n=1 Tax=Choiromyces venosus 120613-1 TaxID=1336337 RepID=A0A3N4K1T1_9PEZI|nr:hypothetical protein L873DRAFT_1933951 [Choiromyces venosus 120613-1]